MNESDYVVGTCETMCPPSEVAMRKKNKLIHFFEQNERNFVKEFSRSAADKRSTKAFELRTFGALQNTLEYLFNKILFNQEKPFNYRYDFIFDRCRAVRQEIVIQNFPCGKTVQLLEPMVMFLSFSIYRLDGSSMNVFDSKICFQHLQECILKCLTCYDEMDRLTERSYSADNRIIIEGIYLMLNMNDTSALQRTIKLDTSLKTSSILRISIHIALNFHIKNYYKVLKDIQDLPHLLGAVASLQFPRIRKEMLHVFSIAYNSSTLTVPVDFLQRLMIYDESQSLSEDLKHLGINDECDESPTKVVFRRTKFDSSKSISSTKHQFVEQKLRDYHIPDLICFKTV